MKKEKKPITKVFSLTEFTLGKVKRLTLHFQDIPSYDKPGADGKLLGDCAIMSGTVQLFIPTDKKKVRNINFTYPLQENTDLKRHVLSIIKSAMDADKKTYGN